jgi:hypothetical protein
LNQSLREDSAPLAALRNSLAAAPWFAACGQPLGPGERDIAFAYLTGLGFDPSPLEGVASWREAARLIQDPDWSRDLWAAESAAEKSLYRAGLALYGESRLLELLSEITEAAAPIHDNALRALSRAQIADATLAKVAAGAAAQACHQQTLAILGEAPPGHAFARKFQLFALGRWPLGLVARTAYVF